MGTLIDSSIFIASERGAFDFPAWLTSHPDETFFMAAVTASELLHGIHRAQSTHQREVRRRSVEAAIAQFQVLPFDLEAARIHAEVWADLAKGGHMIGSHDLMIAATARAHGHSVMTLNRKDFDRVPSLEVISP